MEVVAIDGKDVKPQDFKPTPGARLIVHESGVAILASNGVPVLCPFQVPTLTEAVDDDNKVFTRRENSACTSNCSLFEFKKRFFGVTVKLNCSRAKYRIKKSEITTT